MNKSNIKYFEVMKQTTKRFYGTLAALAFFSGITGAFAFSLGNRIVSRNSAFAVETVEEPQPSFMTCSNAGTPAQPIDLTEAAEKGCASVVYIKVTAGGDTKVVRYRNPFADIFGDFFGDEGMQQRVYKTPKQHSSGSGVIISSDGYIVTNNHVVDNASKIEVKLNDNREFTATVVGTDPASDLALIKIDAKSLPAIVIGDSETLKVGEWVLAIGNPFNLTSTVTAGIVSAKGRGSMGTNGVQSFIQTDAAINKGNSGGALVNARGELVGINAMLLSETGGYQGYGFAIPVSIMKKVVSDIKEYGAVQRAVLGIKGGSLSDIIDSKKYDDENYVSDYGTNDGVLVDEVIENGSAEEAGIKKGDVIVAVGDKKITKMSELQEDLAKFNPGDKTSITIIRDKKEKKVNVTFRNVQGSTKVTKALSLESCGLELKELSDKQKKAYNIANGIQVANVKAGPFKTAGVPKGFIIRKCNGYVIKTIADFEKAFKLALDSEERALFITGQIPAGEPNVFAVMFPEE